jgi:hypothetical protein
MSALMTFLFGVGLIVRLIRWVRGGGFAGRGRRAHAGAARHEWARREFADDVPVHHTARSARSQRPGAAARRRRG